MKRGSVSSYDCDVGVSENLHCMTFARKTAGKIGAVMIRVRWGYAINVNLAKKHNVEYRQKCRGASMRRIFYLFHIVQTFQASCRDV